MDGGAGGDEEYRSLTISLSSGGDLGVSLENEAGGGVRIAAAEDVDLVAAAGLRVGDVIFEINGREVNDHEEALFAMMPRPALNIRYRTAAEQTAVARAEELATRKQRKCVCATLLIGFILGGVACTAIRLLAYYWLPQHLLQDRLDQHVLPLVGIARPLAGADGKPIRRVVPSSNLSAPWEVPGWDIAKEANATARVKKLLLWETRHDEWSAEGGGDPWKVLAGGSKLGPRPLCCATSTL